MTHDVRQWLAEIKHLQQKLTETQQERDEAYASAASWRNLYETEAQQRRTEAHLARQTVDALKLEIEQIQSRPQIRPADPAALSAIQTEVGLLQGVQELQTKLADALVECDRLTQSLKAEQVAHLQTRKSLTTALGDTIDMLTKERTARSRHLEVASSDQQSAISGPLSQGNTEDARNPSLELPLLDQAQFPA